MAYHCRYPAHELEEDVIMVTAVQNEQRTKDICNINPWFNPRSITHSYSHYIFSACASEATNTKFGGNFNWA